MEFELSFFLNYSLCAVGRGKFIAMRVMLCLLGIRFEYCVG